MIIGLENLIIVIAVASFFLFSFRNIKCGLYLVIFCMPLYIVRFSVFGIPTTLLEVMIYVLFILWVLRESRNRNQLGRLFAIFRKEKKLFYGIVLLFAGLLIATAYSEDLKTSLGIVKGWFLDPFLVFLIFASCIKEEINAKKALLSWALSGFFVAIVGIGYYFAGNLTFDGRLKAFYLSPNHFAMYLAPAFLIFAYFAIKKNKLFKNKDQSNLFLMFGICLIFLSLVLSRSFGALAAAAVSLALFCYPSIKNLLNTSKKDRVKYVLISSMFIILILFSAYGKLSGIYDSNGRSSFHSRLMIWNASWEMIKESPVIGIGPGTFQEKYLSLSTKFNEPYLEWAVPQPHNIFLAFYLQAGVLGFAGFIFLVFWVYGRDDESDISRLLMAYILIHGLVDTTYWKNDLAVMFWLVLGIACSVRSREERKARK